MDATVYLKPAAFGVREKTRVVSTPEIERLLEEWRLARRAGDRDRARLLAGQVEEAREALHKAIARR